MSTVLAIDQGTSGTKALVTDSGGGVLGLAEIAVAPRYLSGGGVEQDPSALLASVVEAGRAAVSEAGVQPDIVTLANQGESVLAWDPADGTPLSTVIGWQDRRSESITSAMADSADLIARRTGLALDPYFSAPKLAWLRRNVTSSGVVTTTDSWLVHALCGAFVTDVSTASRSLLMDVDRATWDPELVDLFGLGDERLPDIVASDDIVGDTTVFGGVAKVGGLVVDQQAALFGERCIALGDTKCTFGTGAFLLANTGGTAPRSQSGLATSVAWTVRDATTYCLDGQVYAAASAVRWLTQLGLVNGASDLDAIVEADAGGVLAVPALAGLGAPWWRPQATASLHGMTLSTTAGHVALAVLQGIAAQVAELTRLASVDLGAKPSTLRADGGLTRSRALMQAVADVAQLPVEIYPEAHATALGAAGLARMALDRRLTLDEAAPTWTASTTYEPQWSADQAEGFRLRWLRAAQVEI